MRSCLGAAGTVLGLAVGVEDVVRVRGTIERVESGTYSVQARDGSTLRMTFAANAGVAASLLACGEPAGRRHADGPAHHGR